MHKCSTETTGASRCAALSVALGEPLAGTAAAADTWLCLEQHGPWGRDALTQSHLDAELGAALAERADSSGVRVQLIRRPGRHPDAGDGGSRRIYLAHTRPGASWLRTAESTDPSELLALDFDRLADGKHDHWGDAVTDPVLLVCTNGKRDQCCAVRGRALIEELAGRHDGALWETTHTGGHRFAPAAVLLPSGYTYGRLDARHADAVLSAACADKVVTDHCRGRSCWDGAGQAAELAVREHAGEYLADALWVRDPAPSEAEGRVRIAHRDGRQWAVAVQRRTLDPPRPNSCGKSAIRPVTWGAGDVSELP
ncbi:sucrase ferredoxin [Haloactinomyces albus]|uniref:Sucrase ferredoxin n=1 Tax=Haloactinomyces albus TaxID=1352928 RepID=A0AAE3ZBU5_9ACTN|nr:sucrase ferredoxin [Haloactinomyces albus]MDR7301020.1 hypothetical protein [Haloactinomyces albus]